MWNGTDKQEVKSITYNGETIQSETNIVTKNEKNQYQEICPSNSAPLDKDKSAINYYIEALEFSKYINELISLNDAINSADKIYINDQLIYGTGQSNNAIAKPTDIFKLTSSDALHDPENNQSNFVNHKRDIIKLSIENNLQIAFNNYTGAASTYEYQLPKLTDEDWEKVYKNVSIISFMQGLQVGSKIFNDYSVVTSTGNEEYIDPENIYFIDNSDTYHRIDCDKLTDIQTGYKSCTYIKQNKIIKDGGVDTVRDDDGNLIGSGYILKDIKGQTVEACYQCMIESKGDTLYGDDGILLKNIADQNKVQSYYTVLARERYNLMRLKATRILNSSLYR